MPSFQCPHCGNTTEIDDRFLGKAGECVNCARPIVVPESLQAPKVERRSERPAWLQFSLIGAAIALFGMLAFGISNFVVKPVVRQSIASSRAGRAKEQARQIISAIYAYEAEHGHLPPAYTVDANGKKLHSWRTLILPYLGPTGQSIYSRIDLNEPWDGPNNAAWANHQIFQAPDDQPFVAGDTSFCVVTHPRFAFHQSTPTRLSDLKDDLSTLLMVIEVRSSGINWMEPRDVDLPQLLQGLNAGGRAICGSYRADGTVACGFADGSGRLISQTTGPDVLQEMATIAGGETPAVMTDD